MQLLTIFQKDAVMPPVDLESCYYKDWRGTSEELHHIKIFHKNNLFKKGGKK